MLLHPIVNVNPTGSAFCLCTRAHVWWTKGNSLPVCYTNWSVPATLFPNIVVSATLTIAFYAVIIIDHPIGGDGGHDEEPSTTRHLYSTMNANSGKPYSLYVPVMNMDYGEVRAALRFVSDGDSIEPLRYAVSDVSPQSREQSVHTLYLYIAEYHVKRHPFIKSITHKRIRASTLHVHASVQASLCMAHHRATL